MRLPNWAISLAWRTAARLGPAGCRRLASAWGATAGRLKLRGQVNWANNIAIATGVPPTSAQVRAAAASWLRNLLESISLENWTTEQVNASVVIDAPDWARLQHSFNGPGAVLALGHLGSWDLSGTWACLRAMPVSSVAEHLLDVRFEHFLRARQAMGMRIHPLGDPGVFAKLELDVSERRLVCLLADRDLSGNGVKVQWPGTSRQISVPVGPALLANRTGADLLVVRSHYEGKRMRLKISAPIAHQEGSTGVQQMMQEVVHQLAVGVSESPTDWHMYTRFFKEAP